MSKVLIIAEAGVNHNGSLEMAKKLVEAAAMAGADIVKFQTFFADQLVSAKAAKADYQLEANDGSTQLEMLKKLELTQDSHYDLIDHCRKNDILFFSTAFDELSIDFLASLNLNLWKIPSGEITNLPYLKKIGKFNQRVIVSTGMSTIEEVLEAINILIESGTEKNKITVLHCNTEYPTPMVDVNLKAMLTIRRETGLDIGYSDHTLGIEVPIAAVALGAVVIEKHFTLDRTLSGPDHRASLEPNELKAMVSAIRNIESAMGDGRKKPSSSELKNVLVARKSIHLKNDLEAGVTIEAEHLIMKRPGDGISPMKLSLVLGRKAIRYLLKDTKLSFTDLQ
jgi:N,N'-diacetyllegionaminate synthase